MKYRYSVAGLINQEKDISAEIIDFDMRSAQQAYKQLFQNNVKRQVKRLLYTLQKKEFVVPLNTTEAFQRGQAKIKNLKSEDCLVSDDMDAFASFVKGKYDVIISGSDEIWRIKQMRGFPNPYFLPGDLGVRKVAYAASSRTDFGVLSQEQHQKLKQYLHEYAFISVRDKLTYDAARKEGISEEKLMLSCDPSFLYDFPKEEITAQELLKEKCRLDPSKKILVLADIHQKITAGIISQVKREYNVISTNSRNSGCINIADLDPFEWRLLLSKADVVVTSLFHGACFCITNNTPFIVVPNEDKKDKIQDLLFSTEFENHYVDANDALAFDWKERFAVVSEKTDYRSFVLRQRKDFDSFLRKLRGGGK